VVQCRLKLYPAVARAASGAGAGEGKVRSVHDCSGKATVTVDSDGCASEYARETVGYRIVVDHCVFCAFAHPS